MSEDFQQALRREAEAWVQEGIISAAQRDSILARRSADGEESTQQRKLIATIATMGAVLFGVGVILFFASNWQSISPAQKMALLLAVLVACHFIGYRLEAGPDSYPKMSRAVNLLGCILYGSNIFLLAQAYNIKSHWQAGIFWWAAGTLPLALLLDSKAMGALGYGLLTFWAGAELVAAGRWADSGWAGVIIFLAWGCAGLGLGRVLTSSGRFRRSGEVFQAMGLAVALGAAFPTTYFERYGTHKLAWEAVRSSFTLTALYFGAGGAGLASAAWLVAAGRDRLNLPLGLWVAGALGWAACATFLLPLGTAAGALAGNGLYFAGILGLLFMGYNHSVPSYINLGLLAFSALVVGRYFDFVWKYVDRAGGFILGGLLLLAFGFMMERGRRALLRGPGPA